MPAPEKAYNDTNFLNSRAARALRILSEYEHPLQRFQEQDIHHNIVFFGSARAPAREEAGAQVEALERQLAEGEEGARAALEDKLKQARRRQKLARFYEESRELARKLTEWDLQREGCDPRYVVTTGGGPGIMEAANRGAAEVKGGRSVGLGISLPFEQGVNKYVSEELAFEFHYFFMRKYWFMYLAQAVVVLPGGFGTLDELFEMLTLMQTRKIARPIPTVLYGKEYWNAVLNLDKLLEWGTISEKDLSLFTLCNSPDEAFDYLTDALVALEKG